MSSRLRVLAAAVLLAAAVAGGGCSRPSATDCEAALRNWHQLIYWEKAEQEIAAAPPEQRDALRRAKGEERDKQFKAGLDQGIMDCRSSRDHDGVKCMKAATTAAQARKCRAPKED